MSDKFDGAVKVNRCGWKQTVFEDSDGLLPRLYADSLFEGNGWPALGETKRFLIYRYRGSYRNYEKFLRFDGSRVRISGRLIGLPYYNEHSKCFFQHIEHVRKRTILPQGLLFDNAT